MKYKRIYLDHAATTPLDAGVKKAMEPFLSERFGNPGSIHAEGVSVKKALQSSREKISTLLKVHSDEIIFTSGGTESNNLAILGVVACAQKQGKKPGDIHVVTSTIEHSSVRDVFAELELEGVVVSYVGVDEHGIVNPYDIKKSLRLETILVSVMYANNEIGTIQPIKDIAKTIRSFEKESSLTAESVLFHCDASQVPAYLDVRVPQLGIHMLTLDGQKIYGPKGVGVLYRKRGMKIQPLFFGGGQEFGLRPGTENVPGIVGFAEAFEIVIVERKKEVKRLTGLRDYFIKKVLDNIKDVELNGDPHKRVANNVNFSFLGMESDWIILQLDARGIAAGSKSACLSHESGGSYVIDALGKGKEHTTSSVRFTFGKSTTKKDLDYTVETLLKIVDPDSEKSPRGG